MASKRLGNALAGAAMGYMAGDIYRRNNPSKPDATPALSTDNSGDNGAWMPSNMAADPAAVTPVPENTASRKGSVNAGTSHRKAAPVAASAVAAPSVVPDMLGMNKNLGAYTPPVSLDVANPEARAYPRAGETNLAPGVSAPGPGTRAMARAMNPASAARAARMDRVSNEALARSAALGDVTDARDRMVRGYADGGKVTSGARSFPKKGK